MKTPHFYILTLSVNFAILIYIIRTDSFLCKKKEAAKQPLFVTTLDDIPLCNTLSFVT